MLSFSLMLKKIFENKPRFILTTINFTFGIFLFAFICAIGLNLIEINNVRVQQSEHYKKIYVDVNNNENILTLINDKQNIKQVQSFFESDYWLHSFNDTIINGVIEVMQVDNESANAFSIGEADIAISTLLLEKLNLSESQVLGKTLILTNGDNIFQKTIKSVFNSDFKENQQIHLVTTKSVSNALQKVIIIEVDDVNNVESLVSFLKSHNIESQNFVNEIKQSQTYSLIFAIGALFVSIVLLVCCAYILKISITVSIKNKMGFMAMLKAFGYKNKQVIKIFILEILITSLISCLFALLLYFLSGTVLFNLIDFSIIFETAEANLFKFNFMAFALSVLFCFSVATIICLKPLRTICKDDVVSIINKNS